MLLSMHWGLGCNRSVIVPWPETIKRGREAAKCKRIKCKRIKTARLTNGRHPGDHPGCDTTTIEVDPEIWTGAYALIHHLHREENHEQETQANAEVTGAGARAKGTKSGALLASV
jgi:hypothetical protein